MLRRLRSQVQQHIDSQYRRPRGLIGRWIGQKMADQHQPENDWTVSLLNIQPDDHIVEIGFGPGLAVEKLVARGARVSGVDFSETMVDAARKRVKSERVDLRLGEAEKLSFADSMFDKAYSIHSIYFWKSPLQALSEIHRVLKPDGFVVLTILPKEKWVPEGSEMPLGTPECKPYSGIELEAMLREVGFKRTEIKADNNLVYRSNYSVIGFR
jgi:SAM-dependent methyltransferase